MYRVSIENKQNYRQNLSNVRNCLVFDGQSLLFSFFHQSPSSRKKKRKPFGVDNDDDNNDEGWPFAGWSFGVICFPKSLFELLTYDLFCRTFV